MKVKAGFFSFTEVLDHRHREYNEWHLFDHLPENLKLDGLQWGQRWVATPSLLDRRLFVDDSLRATQYVTLYLLTDPLPRVLDDFYALGRTLHEQGRFFDARRSHLSGPFAVVKTYAASRVPVDADAIPYRPNRGLFVTVQDVAEGAAEGALDEARRWYDEVHIPELLDLRGVAGCWSFEAMPTKRNPQVRTIRAYWLDDDPGAFIDDWLAHVPSMDTIDSSKAYRTLFAGTYESIPWDSRFDWFDRSAP